MPEHFDYQNDDLFNPETHHESSDVPTRPLFRAMIILIVFAVITHLVLLFMYKALIKSERGTGEPPRTAIARPATADVPQNQPLLQPFPKKDHEGQDVYPQRNTPVTDMEDMRRAEDTILKSYGYVDREHGVVRIPIDVAKQLMVARAPQFAAPVTTPIVPPSQTMNPAQAAPGMTPDTGAAAPATTPANTATAPQTSTAPATTAATTTTGGHHQ